MKVVELELKALVDTFDIKNGVLHTLKKTFESLSTDKKKIRKSGYEEKTTKLESVMKDVREEYRKSHTTFSK